MKMAKASEADLRMAMALTEALDALQDWTPRVPTAVEQPSLGADSEAFDRDDREQCVRVLGHLLDLTAEASLMRVVWGCAVMLDPRNRCVDPDKDFIDHHPDAAAGLEAFGLRPLADWEPSRGPVLWWSLPVAAGARPWCGSPADRDWPGLHTHWTPLITPRMATQAAELVSAEG